MKKNIEILKKWRKLVTLNKKEFIVQVIMGILAIGTIILIPIPAANLITSLYNGEFTIAALYALAVFGLHAVRQLFWHLYCMSASTSITFTYMDLQDKIINKFLNIEADELNKNSKEKALNIINNDLYVISQFSTTIAKQIGTFLNIIITIIILIFINVPTGLFLILITVLNYIILNKLNTKRGYWVNKYMKSKDIILEEFSNILLRKNLINKLGIKDEIKNKYRKRAHQYIAIDDRKDWYWYSVIENWFFAFTKLIVVIATIFLIFLISKSALTLTLYLIIIPYIAETMENTRTVFGILESFQNVGISTARVNTLLSLHEDELIEYGENSTDDIEGEIAFSCVSYNNKDNNSDSYGKISNINFKIRQGTICLINGGKQSGKRQIFYLLNRYIKQDKGSILLDGISIFEYDGVYKNNVNSITYKPEFLDGSVIKNFKLIEKDKKKVLNICKKIGIHSIINALPDGYNTDINKNIHLFSNELLFLMAFARVLLTNSEVIMIYEFPTNLSEEEIKNIKNLILEFKEKKTIIIFSANDSVKDISDSVITINRGQVETIEHKDFKKRERI